MDPLHNSLLQSFFASFDVAGLGDGDPVAGTNMLATMACVISNLARPGSGIRLPDGSRFRVGASLLVSGSLSSRIITDDLIIELGIHQNNLIAHLRRGWEDKAHADANRPHRMESDEEQDENPLLKVHEPKVMALGVVEEQWVRIVADPPVPNLNNLMARPRVFVTAARPKDLKGQLVGSHLGQPLVHLGIEGSADFGCLGEWCPSVMDGRFSTCSTGESIKGNLLITDPGGYLDGACKAGKENTRWLGRLLWLVEGNAGPPVPEAGSAKPSMPMDCIRQRYAEALGTAWGRRLKNDNTEPTLVGAEFALAQQRWVAFLKQHEAGFPGITGAARGLLATLLFGLFQLACGTPTLKSLEMSIAGVEAFARFLVVRMVNARAAMLFSADNVRRDRIKERIVMMLSAGGFTARALYRRLTVPAHEFHSILDELMSEERVAPGDMNCFYLASSLPSKVDQKAFTLEV